MEKIFEKLEEPLMKLGDRMNNILFFQVLRDAFLVVFPIIIFGSIVTIVANFPFLDLMIGQQAAKDWAAMLAPASCASINIMAVFLCVGIGYHFTKAKGLEPVFGAATCLCAYFVFFPWISSTAIEGGETAINYAPMTYMGAKGMFVAILVSFLVSALYSWLMSKNLQIKMPDQVPPAVSKSFAALLPASIVLVLCLGVHVALTFTPWENLFALVYEFVQTPLVSLGASLPATMIVIFFSQVFWFFGIQGQTVVNSVMDPVYNTLMLENLDNFTAGNPVTNIATKPFMEVFTVGLGGGGCTLIIVIMLIAFCRSKQLKGLGKIALPAGIFNVNEPFIFGFPVIFNPLVLIPWLIAPTITVAVAYLAMDWGLVPMTTGVSIPFTVPIFLNAFLATNSIAGPILQLVQVAIIAVFWFPFLKVIDNRYFKAEVEAAKAKIAQQEENNKKNLNKEKQ